jgi:hypothetical protein
MTGRTRPGSPLRETFLQVRSFQDKGLRRILHHLLTESSNFLNVEVKKRRILKTVHPKAAGA